MGEWSNGLFSCFDNFKLCIVTYLVPCYVQGKIAETLGESCIMFGLVWYIVPIANIICAAKLRGMVRESKGIEGGFAGDCLMRICCSLCAMVQEAREVGFEMAMGRE